MKPGIEPESSSIVVGFVSTSPQWELQHLSFLSCVRLGMLPAILKVTSAGSCNLKESKYPLVTLKFLDNEIALDQILAEK